MQRPGIWFWIVGGLAVLWNGFGLYDMLMTVTADEAYLAEFTEEQVAYWVELPAWRFVLWAGGAGLALLGSLLFLLRRAAAVPLLAVAPIAMVIGLIADGIGGGLAIYGIGGVAASLVVLGIAIFFVWYAARQRRSGILR